MAPKRNPLNLNPLQLKTLTLLQALSRLPDHAKEQSEGVLVANMPPPHGDHFHLGDGVVATRDASGLFNAAAWIAHGAGKVIVTSFLFPRAAFSMDRLYAVLAAVGGKDQLVIDLSCRRRGDRWWVAMDRWQTEG